MLMNLKKITCILLLFFALLAPPVPTRAQADFDPHFIISDQELFTAGSWTRFDIQKFLDDKGSYLRSYRAADASGTVKSAADIIYDAAQNYQVNPKYLLVTLQKEQSLITDDTPTSKQLDWATGYAVCDSCSMSDPRLQKHKGFGKQVDDAAGIMRWYYDNRANPVVIKKDTPIRIDDLTVTPQSWATAFLYTYTPHLHGNRNFWRIWETWFEGVYPDGTLLAVTSTKDYWLLTNGTRRHFKNMSAVVSRVDPKSAIPVSESELQNYPLGSEIHFSNFSLLQSSTGTYLVDFDTLRPFESAAVVRALGYNPQELIDVDDTDIANYKIGSVITATTTAPEGVVYQITDLDNAYYYFKDDTLTPILNKKILETNFRLTPIEKHRRVDLAAYQIANQPMQFQDGTLLTTPNSQVIYVMANGRKRALADDDTFAALGYQKPNVVQVDLVTLLSIPSGEELFVNSSLVSAKNKFLGDSLAPVSDLAKPAVPEYLIAEYPSGRILSGKNIDTKTPLASLTKLITGYVALHENFAADTKLLRYTDDADRAENNVLSLKTGDQFTRKDALRTMLVASVNQLARAIAHSTGLPEADFVNAANSRLANWGADNTTLVDVTGLSAHNYSTARDILKIFTKVLQEPEIKKAAALPDVKITITRGKVKKVVGQFNTNQIFRVTKLPYTILASKTGYTTEGGATIAMLIESKKTKKQYVIVSLGNMNYAKRFDAPQKLAAWTIAHENSF